MTQQDKIYVIRHLSFCYTDEWYQPILDQTDHMGHITDLFTDKEQAIQAWKQREYEFSHLAKFANIMYCEYSNEEYHGQESLLAQKSVDELFDLIQALECHVYGLYEYPKTLKQQVFFDISQQQYESSACTADDDLKSNEFIKANFIENDPLLASVSPPTHTAFEHYITLTGRLEDLSDAPLLFKNFLKTHPDIQCDDTELRIKAKDLALINPFLKHPIDTEIRYLTLEEIYQLEQVLNLIDPTTYTVEQ